MPAIPLPPASSTGQFNQRAMSLPEFRTRATPDAFGANIAEAEVSGSRRLAGLTEEANRAEASVYTAIGGAINKTVSIVGEQIQKDWKLEAEANLNEMAIDRTRRAENAEPSGDGSYTRGVLEGFDERGRELIDGAASPFQRNIYQEGLQRLRFQAERSAVAQEAAAVKQNRIDETQRLTEAAEIAVFREPGSLLDVRNRTVEAINGSALSARQRRTMVEAFDKRIHAQAIESHIVAGRIGDAEAMLKQDGTIAALGGLESVRMQARVQQAGEHLRERQRSTDLLIAVGEGRALLDPQNTEHRKIYSDAWERSGRDRLLSERNEDAAVYLIGSARTYGMVPKTALSLLNGMALEGNADEQAFALGLVARLENARPNIMQNSGAHEQIRKEAGDFHFWHNVVGISATDAVGRIASTRTQAFRDAHAVRSVEATRLATNRTESELSNYFDNTIGGDPAIGGDPRNSAVILGAYRRAFRDHFERTGNEQSAIAAAVRDLKSTYAATRISGDPGRFGEGRVMRYPVEKTYPAVEGSYDWAAADLDEFVNKHAGRTVPRRDRYYETVPQTLADVRAGRQPGYAVMWFDHDKQEYHTLPTIWRPGFAAALHRASEKARLERERRASGLPASDTPPPSPVIGQPPAGSSRVLNLNPRR